MDNTVLAVMVEGALYCTGHANYNASDVADGHANLVTQFDVACHTDRAEWLVGAFCAGCGISLDPKDWG